MLFHLRDVPEERQPERWMTLRRAITAAEHSGRISVTWVRIEGRHDRVVNDGCDRVYYILEGSGRFQTGDDAPSAAVAGDFVFVPRGTPYEFEGQMTYLVMNGPAFTAGSDRVLPSQMAAES